MTEKVVVYIAYPDAEELFDLDTIAAVDDRIEIVCAPYVESLELRTAKRLGPDTPGLAEMAPGLEAEQRAALRQAEVMLETDAPLDLPVLAPRLRWIQSVSSGCSHFSASRLDDGQIILTNAAGLGAPSIAEFVLGMVIASWKGFWTFADMQRSRQWERRRGRTIKGSSVGIVGLGAIGSALADRIKPLGVTVIAIRRSFVEGMTAPNVDRLLGPDSLHDLLGASDTVILCAADTPETEDLIGRSEFAAMRDGAVFVNVARGNMVDEDALVDSLESGHVRAAFLDVTREEPIPGDSRLWDVEGLMLSPHSAPSLDQYWASVQDLFVENLRNYLADEPLINVVSSLSE